MSSSSTVSRSRKSGSPTCKRQRDRDDEEEDEDKSKTSNVIAKHKKQHTATAKKEETAAATTAVDEETMLLIAQMESEHSFRVLVEQDRSVLLKSAAKEGPIPLYPYSDRQKREVERLKCKFDDSLQKLHERAQARDRGEYDWKFDCDLFQSAMRKYTADLARAQQSCSVDHLPAQSQQPTEASLGLNLATTSHTNQATRALLDTVGARKRKQSFFTVRDEDVDGLE